VTNSSLHNSSINIKINGGISVTKKKKEKKKKKRKENVKEPQVKEKVPLSSSKLQENSQCKHSTGGPSIRGPYSISHCTAPSLEMQLSYKMKLTNNYEKINSLLP
jgi:hypothetical protein